MAVCFRLTQTSGNSSSIYIFPSLPNTFLSAFCCWPTLPPYPPPLSPPTCRLFGGVHFSKSTTDGLALGLAVAKEVMNLMSKVY